MKDSTKCPYCKDKIQTRDFDAHLQIEHYQALEDSKKRVKIGLVGAVIGISIVIGMIWGNLI